jgi:hypothetical protein
MNLLPLYLIITIFMGNSHRNKQSLLGALFYIVLPPPPLQASPIAITPKKVENSTPKKRGSRGCSPHAATPSGAERGSPSQLPQRITERVEKECFNRTLNP